MAGLLKIVRSRERFLRGRLSLDILGSPLARHRDPHRFPMLASTTVLATRPDLQSVGRGGVAVTAAWAAGKPIMDPQFDLAQGTLGLDH